MTDDKKEVFISYHTDSGLAYAKEIAEELESVGIWCFYAYRDIREGNYKEQIVSHIKDSKIFLLILNEGATQSEDVEAEVSVAKHFGVSVILYTSFQVLGRLEESESQRFQAVERGERIFADFGSPG